MTGRQEGTLVYPTQILAKSDLTLADNTILARLHIESYKSSRKFLSNDLGRCTVASIAYHILREYHQLCLR